jgi:arylsulfatase A-like enzyme
VFGNNAPDGGFEKFHAQRLEDSTIGTWMKAAGYRTGFMGKYLNGYPDTAAKNYVPPGWDEWSSPAAGNPYSEFNYTMNENGNLVQYGNTADDYMTDVLSRKANAFIQQTGSDKRPFFLFVATYAPHQPATPALKYANAFQGEQAPRPPSYNEADVSDKPDWIKSKPVLGEPAQRQMDNLMRRRMQTMLSVRDLVEGVVDTLRKQGLLDNTYIIFTSDNGFHLGEHRLHAGKLTPYDEDINVPLFVRGPGIRGGQERKEFVANIDLAPTIAELAGATVPDFVDGRSMVSLLRGETPERWRLAFLVEQEEQHFNQGGPNRQVLEPQDLMEQELAATQKRIPAYAALRTATHMYAVYSTGEKELYDLTKDPYELNNIINTADKKLVEQLDKWLNEYRNCKGEGCRKIDSAPPK